MPALSVKPFRHRACAANAPMFCALCSWNICQGSLAVLNHSLIIFEDAMYLSTLLAIFMPTFSPLLPDPLVQRHQDKCW